MVRKERHAAVIESVTYSVAIVERVAVADAANKFDASSITHVLVVRALLSNINIFDYRSPKLITQEIHH